MKRVEHECRTKVYLKTPKLNLGQGLLRAALTSLLRSVHHGVQQRHHHRVEHGHQPVLLGFSSGLGPQVDDGCTAKMHNDHSEMSRAGGEGLVPARCQGDPHDGGYDGGVGKEDEEEGADEPAC